jgi:hypothetical protein
MLVFQRAQLFATGAARLQEFRWPQKTADVVGAIHSWHNNPPYPPSQFLVSSFKSLVNQKLETKN